MPDLRYDKFMADGALSQADRSKQGEAVIDAAVFSKLLASHTLRPSSSFCCENFIILHSCTVCMTCLFIRHRRQGFRKASDLAFDHG